MRYPSAFEVVQSVNALCHNQHQLLLVVRSVLQQPVVHLFLQINENVCLTFADNSGHRYVSVSGTANVLEDRNKVEELWDPSNRAFWDNKNDPNIRVLRVRPSMAEFWDSPGKLVTTVKMAAAALTGAKPDLGENRKVML